MLLIKTKTHICLASASRPSLANLNKSNVSVLEAHHVSGRSVDSMLGGKKNTFFLPLLGVQFIIIDFSFCSTSAVVK